jgi:hypothetical protein
MITTICLGLWLAWVSWAVEAGVPVMNSSDNSLICGFVLNNLEFDLCPLLNAKAGTFDVSIDEETPPTRTERKYALGFGGELERDGTLPTELQVCRAIDVMWEAHLARIQNILVSQRK